MTNDAFDGPLEEYLDIVSDQAELDAIGKLLLGSKRKPLVTLRCQRHHALARVYELDGAQIVVVDAVRELGGTRARGVERALEPQVKVRGRHIGNLTMRCRCGNHALDMNALGALVDALPPGVSEAFTDRRIRPATSIEDYAERQRRIESLIARRRDDSDVDTSGMA